MLMDARSVLIAKWLTGLIPNLFSMYLILMPLHVFEIHLWSIELLTIDP